MYQSIYTISKAIFIVNDVPDSEYQEIQTLISILEQHPYQFTITKLLGKQVSVENVITIFQSLANEDIDGRIFIFLAGKTRLGADDKSQYYICSDDTELNLLSYIDIFYFTSLCSAKHLAFVLDTFIDLNEVDKFLDSMIWYGDNPKKKKSHQFVMRDKDLGYSLAKAFSEYLTQPNNESISVFYFQYYRAYLKEFFPLLNVCFKNDGDGDFLFDENSYDKWMQRIEEERNKKDTL